MLLKTENIALILSICIIIYLLYRDCINNKVEHMSNTQNINIEALGNLASMYANGKMIVDEIEVQKNVTIKGDLTVKKKGKFEDYVNVNKQIVFGKTKIEEGAGGALKVITPYGWGEFGPQNKDWLHINTDRGKIFIHKQAHVNGHIATYNKDGIDDTRRLKSLSRIGGFAVDGDGPTILLEDGKHALNGSAKYNVWSNDRWDYLFLFKGWKLETWDRDDYKNPITNTTNTNDYIKRIAPTANRVSSYRLTWVGY